MAPTKEKENNARRSTGGSRNTDKTGNVDSSSSQHKQQPNNSGQTRERNSFSANRVDSLPEWGVNEAFAVHSDAHLPLAAHAAIARYRRASEIASHEEPQLDQANSSISLCSGSSFLHCLPSHLQLCLNCGLLDPTAQVERVAQAACVQASLECYAVKLYVAGKWRRVDVDEAVPVDALERPLLVWSRPKMLVWPLIMSKALLRAAAAIDANVTDTDASFVLSCFTGRIPETLVQHSSLTGTSSAVSTAQLFDRLQYATSYAQSSRVVSNSQAAQRNNSNENRPSQIGTAQALDDMQALTIADMPKEPSHRKPRVVVLCGLPGCDAKPLAHALVQISPSRLGIVPATTCRHPLPHEVQKSDEAKSSAADEHFQPPDDGIDASDAEEDQLLVDDIEVESNIAGTGQARRVIRMHSLSSVAGSGKIPVVTMSVAGAQRVCASGIGSELHVLVLSPGERAEHQKRLARSLIEHDDIHTQRLQRATEELHEISQMCSQQSERNEGVLAANNAMEGGLSEALNACKDISPAIRSATDGIPASVLDSSDVVAPQDMMKTHPHTVLFTSADRREAARVASSFMQEFPRVFQTPKIVVHKPGGSRTDPVDSVDASLSAYYQIEEHIRDESRLEALRSDGELAAEWTDGFGATCTTSAVRARNIKAIIDSGQAPLLHGSPKLKEHLSNAGFNPITVCLGPSSMDELSSRILECTRVPLAKSQELAKRAETELSRCSFSQVNADRDGLDALVRNVSRNVEGADDLQAKMNGSTERIGLEAEEACKMPLSQEAYAIRGPNAEAMALQLELLSKRVARVTPKEMDGAEAEAALNSGTIAAQIPASMAEGPAQSMTATTKGGGIQGTNKKSQIGTTSASKDRAACGVHVYSAESIAQTIESGRIALLVLPHGSEVASQGIRVFDMDTEDNPVGVKLDAVSNIENDSVGAAAELLDCIGALTQSDKHALIMEGVDMPAKARVHALLSEQLPQKLHYCGLYVVAPESPAVNEQSPQQDGGGKPAEEQIGAVESGEVHEKHRSDKQDEYNTERVHMVTSQQFDRLVQENKLLGVLCGSNNRRCGIPYREILRAAATGKVAVFEGDASLTGELSARGCSVAQVYIAPPHESKNDVLHDARLMGAQRWEEDEWYRQMIEHSRSQTNEADCVVHGSHDQESLEHAVSSIRLLLASKGAILPELGYGLGEAVWNASVRQHKRRPVRIAVVGPPRSGRSTIASRLASSLGIPLIQLGAEIKVAAYHGTYGPELQRECSRATKKLERLSEDTELTLLSYRMKQNDCWQAGWVLDGLPRSKKVAEALINGLPDVERIDKLINLQLSQRVCKERMSSDEPENAFLERFNFYEQNHFNVEFETQSVRFDIQCGEMSIDDVERASIKCIRTEADLGELPLASLQKPFQEQLLNIQRAFPFRRQLVLKLSKPSTQETLYTTCEQLLQHCNRVFMLHSPVSFESEESLLESGSKTIRQRTEVKGSHDEPWSMLVTVASGFPLATRGYMGAVFVGEGAHSVAHALAEEHCTHRKVHFGSERAYEKHLPDGNDAYTSESTAMQQLPLVTSVESEDDLDRSLYALKQEKAGPLQMALVALKKSEWLEHDPLIFDAEVDPTRVSIEDILNTLLPAKQINAPRASVQCHGQTLVAQPVPGSLESVRVQMSRGEHCCMIELPEEIDACVRVRSEDASLTSKTETATTWSSSVENDIDVAHSDPGSSRILFMHRLHTSTDAVSNIPACFSMKAQGASSRRARMWLMQVENIGSQEDSASTVCFDLGTRQSLFLQPSTKYILTGLLVPTPFASPMSEHFSSTGKLHFCTTVSSNSETSNTSNLNPLEALSTIIDKGASNEPMEKTGTYQANEHCILAEEAVHMPLGSEKIACLSAFVTLDRRIPVRLEVHKPTGECLANEQGVYGFVSVPITVINVSQQHAQQPQAKSSKTSSASTLAGVYSCTVVARLEPSSPHGPFEAGELAPMCDEVSFRLQVMASKQAKLSDVARVHSESNSLLNELIGSNDAKNRQKKAADALQRQHTATTLNALDNSKPGKAKGEEPISLQPEQFRIDLHEDAKGYTPQEVVYQEMMDSKKSAEEVHRATTEWMHELKESRERFICSTFASQLTPPPESRIPTSAATYYKGGVQRKQEEQQQVTAKPRTSNHQGRQLRQSNKR